jgi:hypothetical protein
MLQANRQEIFFLLDKIKTRPRTFGAVLSEITLLKNNQTTEMKTANVLILFLLLEFWHRFKHQQSRLREEEIVAVLAEAFHRLLYHLYGDNEDLTSYLLWFLNHSSFDKHPAMVERVSCHLLALHKLAKSAHNAPLVR